VHVAKQHWCDSGCQTSNAHSPKHARSSSLAAHESFAENCSETVIAELHQQIAKLTVDLETKTDLADQRRAMMDKVCTPTSSCMCRCNCPTMMGPYQFCRVLFVQLEADIRDANLMVERHKLEQQATQQTKVEAMEALKVARASATAEIQTAEVRCSTRVRGHVLIAHISDEQTS
jgi:hypothetical protein